MHQLEASLVVPQEASLVVLEALDLVEDQALVVLREALHQVEDQALELDLQEALDQVVEEALVGHLLEALHLEEEEPQEAVVTLLRLFQVFLVMTSPSFQRCPQPHLSVMVRLRVAIMLILKQIARHSIFVPLQLKVVSPSSAFSAPMALCSTNNISSATGGSMLTVHWLRDFTQEMMKLQLNVNSILHLLEEVEETVDLPKVVDLDLVDVLADLLVLAMHLVYDQVDHQLAGLEPQVLLSLVLVDFPSQLLQEDFPNKVDHQLVDLGLLVPLVDFLSLVLQDFPNKVDRQLVDLELQGPLVDFLSLVLVDFPSLLLQVDFLNRDLVDLPSLLLVHMVHHPQLHIPGLHET